MTLIIGIKCTDGIVVASDGAATLGSLGTSTALQPTKKLTIVSSKIIVGVSGPVGLGQKIKGEVESAWAGSDLSGKKPFQAMAILSEKARKHMRPEFEMATLTRNTIGQTALSSAISSTIIAMPVSREACLFQLDQQGSSEESTIELPFASIGCGQPIADPFLGFIRRIFWSEHPPTLNEGIFAALWTLNHAIDLNPGGVAAPIQITTLSKNGSDWVAKELCDTELQEHYDAIDAAENKLANFRDDVQSEAQALDIPNP